jgi:hypothetical protein
MDALPFTVSVVGGRGSGKTALIHALRSQLLRLNWVPGTPQGDGDEEPHADDIDTGGASVNYPPLRRKLAGGVEELRLVEVRRYRGVEEGLYRRIVRFYREYCPEKEAFIAKLLAAFTGVEDDILLMLTAKYGPEPKTPLPPLTCAPPSVAELVRESVSGSRGIILVVDGGDLEGLPTAIETLQLIRDGGGAALERLAVVISKGSTILCPASPSGSPSVRRADQTQDPLVQLGRLLSPPAIEDGNRSGSGWAGDIFLATESASSCVEEVCSFFRWNV